MWLVAFQQLQDNKWVFELFSVIGDTTTYKAYVINFVVFLISLNILEFLKT